MIDTFVKLEIRLQTGRADRFNSGKPGLSEGSLSGASVFAGT